MAIKIQGIAGQGGANVVTAGIPSTTESLQTFPGCTVTVFDAGTVNLSSIFSDSAGTVPKANPFTTGSDASWSFYGASGARFDVRFSGTGINTPFTLGDIPAGGAAGGGSGVSSVFGRVGDVVSSTNDYTWAQINKTVSDLADITTRSASDLSSGTLPDARFPAILPAISGQNLTNINLANLVGVLPVTKGGTGTSTQFTAGSVVFAGPSGVYDQDNAKLFWDNTDDRLGIGTATPSQQLELSGGALFLNSSVANLFLKDTSTGFQASSSLVLNPQANNHLRSTSFTSGLVGWDISAGGDAEFANVSVRGAIRSSVFVFNALQATAGTFGVFKSAAKLRADVALPSSPTYGTTTVTLDAVDQDGLSHGASQLFVVNDILRLKEGLTGDTWFKVTAVSDQTTFWRYTVAIMAGTSNVTYRAGLGIADYGQNGDGFIIQTADQANSPYMQMATHPATFTALSSVGTLNVTPRLRVGNLNGSFGFVSNIYGFGAGEYGTVGRSWITVDPTNGVRIGNNTTTLTQVDASGNASFTGSITASSGTVGGWTINSDRLSNSTTHLASNFDVPAGLVSWFGRATNGSSGWVLRDGSSRMISGVLGDGSIYPYIRIFDGTRNRVVIGGLNNAWGSDGSTNSIGMKIWDSSGNLLTHFSDVANSIAGWTVAATKISSTGIDINSGGSAGLAFGLTPPTSASVGTGIWLDKTGLYGLLSNVVQIKVDATTGAISFAGQEGSLDVNGLTLFDIDNSLKASNSVKWKSAGSTISTIQSAKISLDSRLRIATTSPDSTGSGTTHIQALSNAGVGPELRLIGYGSSHATFASKRMAAFTNVDNGVLIVTADIGVSPSAITASTALEVLSTTGAFVPPRMTSTQRDALTAANSMVIYNTTTDKLQVRAAGAWVDLH